MDSLTIEQKIGQLFFIGIAGTEVDDATAKLLARVAPGGVCLFSRNIREAAQVRKLLGDIARRLPVPPILSLDQEGGLVDRLRRVASPMPSAHDVSTRGGLSAVRELARLTAEIVRLLGFNMNFAPTVDVVDPARAQFSNGLYSRAFGTAVEEVILFGGAYLEELQKGGCLGSIKHFPGIGATESDSHERLPAVNLSARELFDTDLRPYRELIESGAAHALMVGHAAYPRLFGSPADASNAPLPASLDARIVADLLRGELGFTGLTITDDLEMGAILENYGIGEACRRAVCAGSDMLLICADPLAIVKGWEAVLDAVRRGAIAERRIDESLARIAEFKRRLSPAPDFDAVRLAQLAERVAPLNAELNH